MTFKERMNLLLHKSECIRVVLYDDTKRIVSHIVRLGKGEKSFEINARRYTIEVERIYFSEGLPTLTYHITSEQAVTTLFDPTKFRSDIESAKRLDQDYNDKIMSELQSNVKEEKMTIQNMIMVGSIVTIAILGIGLFFVYNQVQEINDYIEANKDVIELIKEFLLRNGG